MNFFSLGFAFFLAVIFLIWWALPQRFRAPLLAFANLVFAALLGVKVLAALLFITLGGYVGGLILNKFKNRPLLWMACLGLVAPLTLYKYLPSLAGRFAWASPFAALLAPLGISFYTFKSLSYIIDVFRQKQQAVKNPALYFAYVGFFPQLPMGPIQRPQPFFEALKNQVRHLNTALAINACTRICWALFLKKCLADPLSTHYGSMKWADYGHPPAVLLSLAVYSLYLYFDFAAYSHMAIAFGELLGLPCAENFRSPYFSRSLGEFWRRWHISLSGWLKDYVYIPLGGSRNGTSKLIAATMITFLLSGVWHGSTGGFLVWGGLHGLWLLAGRLTQKGRERFWAATPALVQGPVRSVLSWGFTLLLVGTGWFFFCAETLPQAAALAAHLFTPFTPSVHLFKECFAQINLYPNVLIPLTVFLIISMLVDWQTRETGFGSWSMQLKPWIRTFFCYFCLFAAILFGASGSLPGVYFAF